MGAAVVRRVISVYLALVALAATVQFFVFPFYAYDSDGGSVQAATDVWLVLDWFQAAGLVLLVITACKEMKRRAADPSTDVRSWLGGNFMFYGAVVLTLAFMPNWFEGTWAGPGQNWTVWHIINSVLPVFFAVEAHRLWRPAGE